MLHLFPSRTVALALFSFPIHWYGIMYLLGFVLAWRLLPRLQRLRGLHLSSDDRAGMLAAAVLGVILGGRLGFVLFYQPVYFMNHPSEIFAVWRGGMSSHGGFVGVAVALLVALRRHRSDLLAIADVIVIPIALGLAFGRIGNFINQELYGSVTRLPWGIVVPGVEGMRHPTQIYAVLKDLFIASICFWHLHSMGSRSSALRPCIPGRTFALFLILYGVLRFLVEFLRVQEYPSIDLGVMALTRGQVLTMPVFVIGVWLWWWVGPRKAHV